MNKHQQVVENFNNDCDKLIKRSRSDLAIVRLGLGAITLLLVALVALYEADTGLLFILVSMILTVQATNKIESNIKTVVELKL